MFLHLVWGGVYMDADAAASKIRECFSLADQIVPAVKTVAKLGADECLTIVCSDFYGSYWSWPGQSRQNEGIGSRDPAEILTEVLHWLKSLPPNHPLREQEGNVMAKTNRFRGARPSWFVGASYGGTDDQTEQFIAEGIWKNGYKNKYHGVVRSMCPGDRIAIKASYTRKHDLPFDNQGEFVSVVGIKAVGTIKRNLGDGQVVHVDWAPTEPVREWYFFTNRATVWCVTPSNWKNDGLIAFAFDHKPQDIERFQNATSEELSLQDK
jgi:hypothetical protein